MGLSGAGRDDAEPTALPATRRGRKAAAAPGARGRYTAGQAQGGTFRGLAARPPPSMTAMTAMTRAFFAGHGQPRAAMETTFPPWREAVRVFAHERPPSIRDPGDR